MPRGLRKRIKKAEELAAAMLRTRDENHNQGVEVKRIQARGHATAVAAIVLAGQPRIDEPLNEAWARVMRHYKISDPMSDRLAAVLLFSEVVGCDKDEPRRFSKIFRTAPIWLLQFTAAAMDARILKFRLPTLTAPLKWGSEGFEDARRWPLLPLGVMTAGDPIPTEYLKLGDPTPDFDDRRVWIAFWQTTDPIPEYEYRSPDRHVNQDLEFVLDLAARPESEWSQYEMRRMRRLSGDPELAASFVSVRCLRDLPLPAFFPESALKYAGLVPPFLVTRE
jgi:hypothetical protein